MEKLGIVKSIVDGYMYVEVSRESPCGVSCASCHAACAESKTEIVKVNNLIDAKEGDVVEVHINSRNVLGYFLLVYGLPLLFLFIGTCISYYFLSKTNLKNYDVYSFLIGLVFMLTAYKFISLYDKKHMSVRDNYLSARKYRA